MLDWGLLWRARRRGSRVEGLTNPRAVKGGMLGTKKGARQLAKDKLDSSNYYSISYYCYYCE